MENQSIEKSTSSKFVKVGICSVILLVMFLASKFMARSDSMKLYGPILVFFIGLPSVFFLYGAISKIVGKSESEPPAKNLQRALAVFVCATIIFLFDLLSTMAAGIDLDLLPMKEMIMGIVGFAGLFVVRAGLIMIVNAAGKNSWKDMAWRKSSGFADGILILSMIIYLIIGAQVSTLRLIILGLVIIGFRIGWGYIPEDRFLVLREFIDFLGERKLWWMTPIFLVLGLLMLLVVFTQSTQGAFPFIYAIF